MTVANLTTASYPALYAHLDGLIESIRVFRGNSRSPLLTPEGLDEMLRTKAGQVGWTADIDAIDGELTRRIEAAVTGAAALRASLGRSGDELAAQIRAQRYWARTKAVLDTYTTGELLGKAPGIVSSVAAEDLPTLLEELPTYLDARKASRLTSDVMAGIEAAVHGRFPELSRFEQAENQARTMAQSVFAPMLRHLRELTTRYEATLAPAYRIFSTAQVEAIHARHEAQAHRTTGA